MKKIMMTLAAVLCCAMTTTVVNAQEAESPIKEGERLAKAPMMPHKIGRSNTMRQSSI